ncbi:MAG: chromate efflux transporter [Acidobacteria bacterium]|nr:chromate efflux transporter [Acidobacteriota bacterium]
MRSSAALQDKVPLKSIALVFLKLGTIAFGGPAAHIALMEEEVVRKRGWLTEQEFLDYWSAANLIPGPNSTEMAIHIGHRKAGWRGLLTAGACFILPAASLVTLIAWAYVRFGTLPQVEGLLYAVKPVVIAVVLQALWKLGRSAIKSKWLAAVAAIAGLLIVTGTNELLVLLAGGALALAVKIKLSQLRPHRVLWVPLLTLSQGMSAIPALDGVGLWPMFLIFAKIGSVLFGSGYVLLAFLRADFVERHHWLTSQQLLDAVAVGQFTPGPVFTTATFIGYVLHGGKGALVATLGIFLPAFLFVAVTAPLLPKLRASRTAGHILDGVNVASLALMGVVTWQLGRAAIVDGPTLLIAVASAVLLLTLRVNSAWLVIAAGALGWLGQGRQP